MKPSRKNLKQQRADFLAALSQDAGIPISSAEFLTAAASASKELDEATLDSVTGGAANPVNIRPAWQAIKGWLGLD